jgi:hypothetical protein
MGDGRIRQNLDNRLSRNLQPTWGGCNPMLEWRPRLIAMLVFAVLVATVLVSGFFGDLDPVANWEW